ncbi:hypothetical protein MC7420_6061 [Coleofasciculus chthonoplastes PCC 7420]|uniref:Uncharacterized protein n=1 Tax=Coleofasciculus chthonoplastes PCC 7420 TaxID=118168 RepID=B4VTH9_9CYAN|nr:hypothetical protein MC7420_6061 [Coleofasciculus chthonoplastes PCC 7420]
MSQVEGLVKYLRVGLNPVHIFSVCSKNTEFNKQLSTPK